MRVTRINDVFLPSAELGSSIHPTSDLAEALDGADVVVSAMPSHLVRRMYGLMLPHIKPSTLLVSATKGLENGSLLHISKIITDVVRARFEPRLAVISGPTFAKEVARFEPTALVVSSSDLKVAEAIQSVFSGPTFRLYTTQDTTGVEIGGSIKNVIAIGAGVLHGMGVGHNALAALITRGLAEMTRLAVAMGGKPMTLAGLAGLGDLVLTCNGDLSRNRTVGVELARGRKLDDIVSSMKMVAEGIKTTSAAVELAERHAIEMPICRQMYQMLQFGMPPRDAIRQLMERPMKGELG
jgi:glycerol-3-phosphate dehydrogenase (NAD(P)+)